METLNIPFKSWISDVAEQGEFGTDDIIAFILPLARKLLAIHERGQVIPMGEPGVLHVSERQPLLDAAFCRPVSQSQEKIQELFVDWKADHVEVVGKIKIASTGDKAENSAENLRINLDPSGPLLYPAYFPGYGSYEQLLNHHDPQTDIFSLGLILGSLALGLDLYKEKDLRVWAAIRSNPVLYNPRIHPTLARLVTDMTELDRSRRSQDLYDIVRTLENYREHDPERQADLSVLAGSIGSDAYKRASFILQKLRNRLFDTTRRNRLLYFKPAMRFVNLTVGSVPDVLHYQSIRPEHLFIWNEDLAGKIKGVKEIVLNKYLRFDDHLYLPGALDKLRVESRRSVQEYGLSQLKLVIVFLSWHNLKEDIYERIQTPLLLLPVDLKRTRSLKEDHYVLKPLDNAAEVNPVLAGQLKDLYGIRLPELVDLDEMSIAQFYQLVKSQIDSANQGIALQHIDKPRIMVIHREARANDNNYRKRTGMNAPPPGDKPSFSGEQPVAPLDIPPLPNPPGQVTNRNEADKTQREGDTPDRPYTQKSAGISTPRQTGEPRPPDGKTFDQSPDEQPGIRSVDTPAISPSGDTQSRSTSADLGEANQFRDAQPQNRSADTAGTSRSADSTKSDLFRDLQGQNSPVGTTDLNPSADSTDPVPSRDTQSRSTSADAGEANQSRDAQPQNRSADTAGTNPSADSTKSGSSVNMQPPIGSAANARVPLSADTAESNAGGPADTQGFALVESDNNPYSWDFDTCNMVLGNFNYKKMSLVRDYNLVMDQQVQHSVFDELFSTQPKLLNQHTFDLNRPDDWHHVIQADPTQTRAILQARAGYSYIIQGPPGTGKSQTITNLIADFVAQGKSILFVCEKRAALDVVFHRLKQNGLDELCCYIHDSQGDKKEFIRNLGATYSSFIANDLDLTAIRTRRNGLLDQMNRQVSLIDDFHRTAIGGEKDHGIQTRRLIDLIIALRQDLPTLDARDEERLPDFAEWQLSAAIVGDLSQSLQDAGGQPIFARHPFAKVRDAVFQAENPLNWIDELTTGALSRLEELSPFIETGDGLDAFKNKVQYATLLYPLAVTGNLALADPASPTFRTFAGKMAEYRTAQGVAQSAAAKNTQWRQKIAREELDACVALATKHEGKFFSALNGGWRRLKKHINQSYDFSQHVVRPTCALILANLAAEYETLDQLDRTRQRLQQEYQLENIDTSWLSIELLHGKRGDPQLDKLLSGDRAIAQITALQAVRPALTQLEEHLRRLLQEPLPDTLKMIKALLGDIRQKSYQLPGLLPALRNFASLPTAVKSAVRHFSLTSIQFEAAIARKTLHEVYQSNKQFQTLDRQALAASAARLGEAYGALQSLNADLLRASVRNRFQQDLDLAGMATAQLNEEQRRLKKTINEGRKILENEFGKSMRYKSIRELSEKESGRLLRIIKPIWLMSPYSVSDSLPLDPGQFDVVIFDEASQITLEEGVPALYRSQQAIIVGDERQMPPTDFFSAGPNEADTDDLQDEDGTVPADWLQDDVDSLLAQGSRKLDNTLLSWHYRSHYETLISFSNHAFYGGELLTIPDKAIHHGAKDVIEISDAQDATRQVDKLFDRSISFHYHKEGLYEKRSNLPEAAYIANLVRQLLNRDPGQSIGVVAFSQQQQQAIEDALDALAAEDLSFAQQLEEAYNRTEQDQFVGLIIKNLENIQGDERDIIIMSVCYGYDAKKKMIMNFGPINKRGGEKRLNVLFSRARQHIAVVSSIHHQDITNEYNDGANYLRRFLHYAEMVSLGNMQTARSILSGLVANKPRQTTAATGDSFTRQLKKQIEYLGYEVAEQVGQSGFKCSLAVKAKPEDKHYSLGILVDDDLHYENRNVIEQYYLRPEIMRAFGWKLLPVFAKDWLHQPQKMLDQIQQMLRGE